MLSRTNLICVAALLAACGGSHVSAQNGSVETKANNGLGYKPAFENQTRAPEKKANVAFNVTPVVASGIANPFGFAFLPNGKILITERAGQLRVASADGTLSPPVAGAPQVVTGGQGGLLDVALDPAFAQNGLVYLAYSEAAQGGGNHTAVGRGRLVDGAQPRLENFQVIFRQTPSLDSRLHFGNRLEFGRDGKLYIGLGERSIMEGRVQSQRLDGTLGKVVRINPDGTVPNDNPFVGRQGAKPEIWSIGHRNIQGMDLHPQTGELWVFEHGPRGGDEVNIARKGRDYGWPTISYGAEYRGPKIGEGITQKAGMEQPVYYWDPVIAPGAMVFYDANLFPAWRGSLFATGLNSGYVARLTLDGERVAGEERLTFSDQRERYRDIDVGPDGALYVLTDGPGARLLKVTPK